MLELLDVAQPLRCAVGEVLEQVDRGAARSRRRSRRRGCRGRRTRASAGRGSASPCLVVFTTRHDGAHAVGVSRSPSIRCDRYRDSRWGWTPRCSRHMPWIRAAAVRQRGGARVREDARLPRRAVAVRAPHLRARARTRTGRVTEAFTPDFYLPEQDLYLEVTVMKQSLVTRKNRKLRKLRERYPDVQDQALLRARLRSASQRIRSRPAPHSRCDCRGDERIGEVYLGAAEIAVRVRELGAELARDYAGREPVLVGSLKASVVFLADLSRATADPARPRLRRARRLRQRAEMGGHERIRFLKDLDMEIAGRDVRDRRGGDRHRPDDALPPRARSAARARVARRALRSSTGRTAASSTTCRSATSASRSPTSSSSATASPSTSAAATCPTCTWSSSLEPQVAPPARLSARLNLG